MRRTFWFFSVLGIAVLDGGCVRSGVQNTPAARGILTNDSFIRGLYTKNDNFTNARKLFEHVFSQLEDEVTVYTGENNYYVQYPIQGRIVGSILSLSVEDRDKGKIGFSYIERNENIGLERLSRRIGGGKIFSAEDGVRVSKVNDFAYRVTFNNKTVKFNLYQPGLQGPPAHQMGPHDVFVGPVIDESGFDFHLMFDRAHKRLFMVLDERRGLPDVFTKLENQLVIAERSRFAFFDDSTLQRKILIGVHGDNTLENNWWDGPHDQMPDNYIALGRIPHYQEILEASYPGSQGRIDKFGRYIHEPGTRIAIAPYTVYFSLRQIKELVQTCRRKPATQQPCLTLQRYRVPRSKQVALSSESTL